MKELKVTTDKLHKLDLKRSMKKIKYKKYNEKYINFSSRINRIYQENN